MSDDDPVVPRPAGREAVEEALIDATIDLVVARGAHVSVRDIAAHAGVNHGLVHTYFGSKSALLSAAADEINARTAASIRPDGFPPPDLLMRNGGLLAKALARIELDDDAAATFRAHPVSTAWVTALREREPDLSDEAVQEVVALAGALALGWAMYREYLCAIVHADAERSAELDEAIYRRVAELGHIPSESSADAASPDRAC